MNKVLPDLMIFLQQLNDKDIVHVFTRLIAIGIIRLIIIFLHASEFDLNS